MAGRKLSHEGTLVLDCEGLSKFVGDDERVVAMVTGTVTGTPSSTKPHCASSARSAS